MRLVLVLCIALLAAVSGCDAQSQPENSATYSCNPDEYGNAVLIAKFGDTTPAVTVKPGLAAACFEQYVTANPNRTLKSVMPFTRDGSTIGLILVFEDKQ